MYQSHTEIDEENYENYKIEDKTIKKNNKKLKNPTGTSSRTLT